MTIRFSQRATPSHKKKIPVWTCAGGCFAVAAINQVQGRRAVVRMNLTRRASFAAVVILGQGSAMQSQNDELNFLVECSVVANCFCGAPPECRRLSIYID